MNNVVLSSAHIFVGNPTTASGAGMTYLGPTRGNIELNIGLNIAKGRADNTGLTPLATAVRDSGSTPSVTFNMIDEDKDKLVALIKNLSKVTDGGHSALSLGGAPAAISRANLPTLCLLPIDEVAVGTNGIESENAVWFPASIVTEIGPFIRKLAEGEDILSDVAKSVTIEALYVETDQDSPTANAINAALRRGFIGTPEADTGLAGEWSLPAVA